MQLIVLGFITGILFSILVIATLIFFKKPIEKNIKTIERIIESKSPKQKGFIIEPKSDEIEDAKEFRERIIDENNEHGRDTHIEDLI